MEKMNLNDFRDLNMELSQDRIKSKSLNLSHLSLRKKRITNFKYIQKIMFFFFNIKNSNTKFYPRDCAARIIQQTQCNKIKMN